MNNKPIELEINGTLDLHHFKPSEVKELVHEYLLACLEREIMTGRIIHGKGKGTLREMVHNILKKHPHVSSFALGSHNSGSWGSTTFFLHKQK
jgi:DNA-nicking Smr family endonuclease